MSISTSEVTTDKPAIVGVVETLSHKSTSAAHIETVASNIINQHQENASFRLTDLSSVCNQYDLWLRELESVEPFYAVKANPDKVIIRVLAALGCGFDVASQGEIELVRTELEDLHQHGVFKVDVVSNPSLGIESRVASNMIFANPCKQHAHIEHALQHGVRMMTFDCENELHKIAAATRNSMQVNGVHEKSAQLLLRISTDDDTAMCSFSNKFGCAPGTNALELVDIAATLNLDLIGVCFHVGSGCAHAGAYTTALKHSLDIFKYCESKYSDKFSMSVLDIGGGFPGDEDYGTQAGQHLPSFTELASVIRHGLANFPKNIRIIAEPGRFFSSAATTVCTRVFGCKSVEASTTTTSSSSSSSSSSRRQQQSLTVDDGVYGTFNNILYDHYVATPSLMAACRVDNQAATLQDNVPEKNEAVLTTAIFGPTCDGLDELVSINRNFCMPPCVDGDWLLWRNMGAYTHTASFSFNGLTHVPRNHYIASFPESMQPCGKSNTGKNLNMREGSHKVLSIPALRWP